MTTVETPVHGLLIGDERVITTDAGVHHHVFPGNGEVNAGVAMAGPAEFDRAVEVAKSAQKRWYALPVDDRRDALLTLAQLVADNEQLLAELSIEDNGNPRFINFLQPRNLVRWLRYYAGWIDKLTGQVTPVSQSDDLNMIVYEPYGVVAVILPWNGPLYGVAMVAVPALAAGNAVIIKPPELAPLTSLKFGELALQAGLPPGLVNVLPADPLGSEALVRHPGVDKIHFTGSAAVARRIQIAAAGNLTPVATELGGKSASIIFDDANLDMAVLLAAFAGPLAQSGQSCACGSRIFVQDSTYDEVVARLTMIMSNAPIGDPRSESTVIGPVISEPSVNRILGMIERAQNSGAQLVTGGRRVGGELASGYFLEPTLFSSVDTDSELFQQEVFGPVATIAPFHDFDEVVDAANATNYGLVNYVHTTDLERAHLTARALKSGTVFVNTYPDLVPTAPYGGYKQSGTGRAGGLDGLLEFCQIKNVRMNLGPVAIPM